MAACPRGRSRRSADKTKISLTMLIPGRASHQPMPTILTAYGGFGRSPVVTYRPDIVAWVLAGGIYAVAHVRGGSEGGAAWHQAGIRQGKLQVLEDVIAAAEALIADGLTTPDRLALLGTSNGGMIMSAVALRRPDLMRACIAISPVTDLIRYPLLGDGQSWIAEYGSPQDPEDFATLMSYSPYHNVCDGTPYPAFLIMSAHIDARVPAGHARKLCAAIQHATASQADKSPVLLREEGHGHGSTHRGATAALATVDRLAFQSAMLMQEKEDAP